MPSTLEDVMAAVIVTESGCWEWTKSRTGHGYGRISWRGHVRKVHRVMAHLLLGLDLADASMVVRHSCDNPPCCNPQHLIIGTQQDNVADMMARGRWAGGGKRVDNCLAGHPLTPDNVKLTHGGTHRRCRECARDSYRRYYERRKSREGAFWKASRSLRALDGAQ